MWYDAKTDPCSCLIQADSTFKKIQTKSNQQMVSKDYWAMTWSLWNIIFFQTVRVCKTRVSQRFLVQRCIAELCHADHLCQYNNSVFFARAILQWYKNVSFPMGHK